MTGNRASIGTRRILAKVAKLASRRRAKSEQAAKPRKEKRSRDHPDAAAILNSKFGGDEFAPMKRALATTPDISLESAEEVLSAAGARDLTKIAVKGM